MPDLKLPAGTQYALTVSIPENYGGMTSSMLQRSRAFVTYAGVDVTILTYEHNAGLDAMRLAGDRMVVDQAQRQPADHPRDELQRQHQRHPLVHGAHRAGHARRFRPKL